ncbi:MAG TPA: tripartite tricarboxylate transporter TctB family protein [Myxococcales bacterium]|nr:tripartite tricarboxylate transporter TctB family protein [Myxococcales bacterium]
MPPETERRLAIRAPQNFVGGLALIAVGVVGLLAARELDTGRFFAVGPALLPRGVSFLLGVLGLGLVAASLLRDGDPLGRWPLRGPIFVFLGVAAFALSVRTAGLAVAGPLVAMVSGAGSPQTRPRELIVFAILVTALCIGLFRYVLHLPIPILIVPGVLVL